MSDNPQHMRKEREKITKQIYYEKYKEGGCTAGELLTHVNNEMSKLHPDKYKPCSISTIKRSLLKIKNPENNTEEALDEYKSQMNNLLIGTPVESFEISETFIIKVSYEKAPMIASLLMIRYRGKIVVTVSHEYLVIIIIKNQGDSAIKDEINNILNIK